MKYHYHIQFALVTLVVFLVIIGCAACLMALRVGGAP